jgi:acetylglutamate kinase
MINETSYEALKKEGIVTEGMIPKLENSLLAISEGVKLVRLCHSDDLNDASQGTQIKA